MSQICYRSPASAIKLVSFGPVSAVDPQFAVLARPKVVAIGPVNLEHAPGAGPDELSALGRRAEWSSSHLREHPLTEVGTDLGDNEMARIVLFGATGTVGQGVLLECLDASYITEVVSVVRRPTGRSHSKLRELVHTDFLDFSSLSSELRGIDACFWCVGIPSAGLTEQRYTEVTHDYTLAAARVLLEQSPGAHFVFVSGEGADETEKSRTMWARVKGRTENAILKYGFRGATVFRPGLIVPKRGIRHGVPLYRWSTIVLTPVIPVLRQFGMATSTVEIGRAMIAAASGKTVGDPPVQRLNSGNINALAALMP